ncbi:p450 domain containing protein [Asbolus verrucosus]|uniref:p450 domain containing protein n=1 Tax=Asbolus verrucosus TaxID=1661398 RepID=A0A482VX72_ASBVE|nr:p450 domain containing protein [Asbolus verrucosus]
MFIFGPLSGVFFVFFVTLGVIVCYCKWCYKYWCRKKLPYLEPSAPFGNVSRALRGEENMALTIRRIYDEMKAKGWKHGGIFMALSPTYLAIDLDCVKNIMTKDFQNFVDRSTYSNGKDDPLSVHLASLSGDKWRNLRARLSPAFTAGKIRMMFRTLLECGVKLQKQMEVMCEDTQPIDIKEVSMRFTTDVIGSYALGLDCECFQRYNKKKIDSAKSHKWKLILVMNYPKLAKMLRVTLTPKEVADFYLKIVKDAVDYRERSNFKRNDFLQLLIDMKNVGQNFTMDEVAAQCYGLFLAGLQTSATHLTFTLYELPDEDVIIEKGTRILIPIIGIHHDEEYYPDPQKFDPERFSEKKKNSRHQYAHIPFGEGPRGCVVNKKTEEPLKMRVHSVILSAEGIWLDAQKL